MPILRMLVPLMAVIVMGVPATTRSQGVVYVNDGQNLPEHRLRGQVRAQADLRAGVSKFYVSVCTFPAADKKEIRRYEIRSALYKAKDVAVMANLCNDIIPNAFQQEAFVTGYNAVMDPVIAKRLGREWKEIIEKQVSIELQKLPVGRLQARDIDVETPY